MIRGGRCGGAGYPAPPIPIDIAGTRGCCGPAVAMAASSAPGRVMIRPSWRTGGVTEDAGSGIMWLPLDSSGVQRRHLQLPGLVLYLPLPVLSGCSGRSSTAVLLRPLELRQRWHLFTAQAGSCCRTDAAKHGAPTSARCHKLYSAVNMQWQQALAALPGCPRGPPGPGATHACTALEPHHQAPAAGGAGHGASNHPTRMWNAILSAGSSPLSTGSLPRHIHTARLTSGGTGMLAAADFVAAQQSFKANRT